MRRGKLWVVKVFDQQLTLAIMTWGREERLRFSTWLDVAVMWRGGWRVGGDSPADVLKPGIAGILSPTTLMLEV